MKKLLLFITILPLISISQNTLQISESRTIYMEKVISDTNYTKEELYDISLGWVSEVFNSPDDVISFSDMRTGKIKGSFISYHPISLSSVAFSTTFTIQVKDKRLKIKFDNITNVVYGASLETYILKKNNTYRSIYSSLTSDVQSSLNNLILDFEKYIKDYSSAADDW
ncbi:MAG: DUF4468 domain-containing protein [Bacteroidetes bacterium]|nr:DUF4468 domain-containing protein [Bacteroidota bacterium]